jgi:Acetyltransferase (GNAT) family.
MDENTLHIDVRAVQVSDAPALHELDNDFETDRIYALRVQNRLTSKAAPASDEKGRGKEKTAAAAFAFELVETSVDPPFYKDLNGHEDAFAELQTLVQQKDRGFVALVDGKVVGALFMAIDDERSVALIRRLIIGRQYRRYNFGPLLLRCASDWGRRQKCWALQVETQNTNFPDVQFYLHNGLEIWSICSHFYPPGDASHEVALFLGKRLTSQAEG